jgi:hypothetical protein
LPHAHRGLVLVGAALVDQVADTRASAISRMAITAAKLAALANRGNRIANLLDMSKPAMLAAPGARRVKSV